MKNLNNKKTVTIKTALVFGFVFALMGTMDLVAPKKEFAGSAISVSAREARCKQSGNPTGEICKQYNYWKFYFECHKVLFPNGTGPLTTSQATQNHILVRDGQCLKDKYTAYLASIGSK